MCTNKERFCQEVSIIIGLILLVAILGTLLTFAFMMESQSSKDVMHWAHNMDIYLSQIWLATCDYYLENPVLSNVLLATLPVVATFVCVFYNLVCRASIDTITVHQQSWGGRRYEYSKFLHSRLEGGGVQN